MISFRLLTSSSQQSHVRFGATMAQRDIEKLVASLFQVSEPVPVVLDFSDIEAINASYCRASVAWLLRCAVAFRDGVKSFEKSSDPWAVRPLRIEHLFVASLSTEVLEEIDGLLCQPSFRLSCFQLRHAPLNATSRPDIGSLLGHLDEQLHQCLIRLYSAGGKSTAASLHETYSEDGVQTTAWNNRLAALYERGLIGRTKDGRTWIYNTVTEELEPHGISLATA